MSRPLPPLAVPAYNPPPSLDKVVKRRLWTAAELISKSSAIPEALRIRFTRYLNGASPSKRKAREFLATLPVEQTYAP